MTVSEISASVTNVTGLIRLELTEGMNQATTNVEVVCTGHSLSLNDSVDVVIGGETVLEGGLVRKISRNWPEATYTIFIQDKLCRAIDYFIASDDPAAPYTASNIKAEDLVEDLLALAGITGIEKDVTIFTYGTVDPVPINLVSVWNMVETISRICGFITVCNAAGVVFFYERKAYVTVEDQSNISHNFTTGDSGQILAISYDQSTENLINKVVVYGANSAEALASAEEESPYLPSGFRKTMVVAHELIDNETAAQGTADVNLEMFNRLTETIELEIKGDPNVRARSICTVVESHTGQGGDAWLIYSTTHSLSREGYKTTLTLVK